MENSVSKRYNARPSKCIPIGKEAHRLFAKYELIVVWVLTSEKDEIASIKLYLFIKVCMKLTSLLVSKCSNSDLLESCWLMVELNPG